MKGEGLEIEACMGTGLYRKMGFDLIISWQKENEWMYLRLQLFPFRFLIRVVQIDESAYKLQY